MKGTTSFVSQRQVAESRVVLGIDGLMPTAEDRQFLKGQKMKNGRANGFEPSTSWSRTRLVNPINALFGVANPQSHISLLLLVPILYLTYWGEPLSWHSFFGHSFRFHRSVLASPSRRRDLGKGAALESPSPAAL